MENKYEVLACGCTSMEHNMVVMLSEDKGQHNAYVTIHLSKLGFLSRLKLGFKYIFGCKTGGYGNFEEVTLTHRNVDSLKNIIKHLNKTK
jgi:hypothetical protein